MVRKEVKRKIIAGLDRDDLFLVALTQEESQIELRWEHSKEFEYKGQMYDIVETEWKDGVIYYWCWWDHEETSLNQKLNKLAAHAFDTSDRKQQQEKKLSYFYQSLYFQETSTDIVWNRYKEDREPFNNQEEFPKNRSNSPPLPPPELS
jgi:hypothetical protein